MGFIKHFETDVAPNSEGINLYFEFPSDIGNAKNYTHHRMGMF